MSSPHCTECNVVLLQCINEVVSTLLRKGWPSLGFTQPGIIYILRANNIGIFIYISNTSELGV